MGSVPLFTPILPPKITSISHDFLAKWKVRRREYEAEIRARCRISGEDYDVVITPIMESFDADLLDTFCELRLNTSAAHATEGMLTAEIEHITSSVKNKTLPDIKALFRSQLHLRMSESDVDARVLDHFNEFGKIVRANGLTDCFSGIEGTREKCKRLVASLHPEAIKAEVKQCVRFTHKTAASNPRELFEHIVEKGTEHERQYQRLKANKNAKPLASARQPPSPCPKCQELHWIRDCPKATEVEKEVMRKELREANQAKRARLKRIGEGLPVASRVVTLNGVLQLPYCPDSGTDYTIISRTHWNQLKAKDPSVEVEELATPVRNQTNGSTWVTTNQKTKLHLLLHTAAGPVEPVNAVDVLIADAEDDEFIVGNDLLTSLGIDVDRQLEMSACRDEDETSGDTIELEADDPPVTLNPSDPSDGDIYAAVECLISRAVENGFPRDKVERLRVIVHAYDVWRLELRADPPANVPPREVRLKDGVRPVKCKPRKYPPHIRQFLHEFNSRLVALGLVYENADSRWASPVLPVKKSADLMDLRQTTDYRAVNEVTEAMAAVMPILSVVVGNARGMNHFGLFDFLKGFWQLPLAELCQEFLSYMTDENVFTPRRVPQGCSDSATHFQKTMERCFTSLLYEHLLVWIDDLLLYATDIETYLDKLAELFSLLNQFGLKLSAKKSSQYQTQVKWCGKVINGQGIRHDAERIDSLRLLPYPRSAGEPQQFLCAINWMRDSIIDFARQVEPLQRRSDAALANTKRTKRAAASISIDLEDAERQAFDQVKDALANAATLEFPDDQATTCLFTDASDIGYANIVTQVANFDSNKPATELQHRLESYSRYAPHDSVKKHVKGKQLRWAMKLMNYHYVIEHVPGPDNLWADMISRWVGNHTPKVTGTRRKAFRRPRPPVIQSVSPLRPLDDDSFVWPTLEELGALQSAHSPPANAVHTDTELLTIDDRLWAPPEATDFIQRLCIVAHCGAQGYRGQHAMIAHLRRLFAIDHVTDIVGRFVRSCLLCLHCRGGKIMPRPWGEVIDCSSRNGVLHFDYLYMGESYSDTKYLLVLRDHAPHFCELVCADTAESMVVTETLLAWHSRFGIPPVWVSNQGSHFKNEVIAELSRRLRTQQTFIPAYSPWVNGSIERINQDILQVIRAMILTYKISYKDWVYLAPMVQSNLNHTPVPSQSIEDSYEPLQELAKAIRVLVDSYVTKAGDPKLNEYWLTLQGVTALPTTADSQPPDNQHPGASQDAAVGPASRRKTSRKRKRQSARGSAIRTRQASARNTPVSRATPLSSL
ncbi:unnamed protein product [Phytophthora fragariaefolia]|uniref:Unnamed protein product n=1 Tax=Phytophthora fragariaefolia TaxID=1490495 RepID=A0A9W6TT64_9STRA|nr:unnamed protein product [Phytophthora fragariaefolia]